MSRNSPSQVVEPQTNNADYGTLEWHQTELERVKGNSSMVVGLAQSLAQKAYANLTDCLNRDFDSKALAKANETNADELYLAEVKQQCDDLKHQIIAQYASRSQSESNTTFTAYNGTQTTPIAALCGLCMIEDTSAFMNIIPAQITDPATWGPELADKFENKVDLSLHSATDRALILPAIIKEYCYSPHDRFSQTV